MPIEEFEEHLDKLLTPLTDDVAELVRATAKGDSIYADLESEPRSTRDFYFKPAERFMFMHWAAIRAECERLAGENAGLREFIILFRERAVHLAECGGVEVIRNSDLDSPMRKKDAELLGKMLPLMEKLGL